MSKKRNCLSQEEIRAYTHDAISPKKQHDIEIHLLDCELCNTAVAYFQQLESGAYAADEQQISDAKEAITVRSNPKIKPLYKQAINRWAAMLLLALCAYAAFRYQQNTRTEQLVSDYLDELPSQTILLRGDKDANVPQSDELSLAMAFVQKADYESSIPHFENHLAQFPTDWQSLLLLGKSQLRSGNYPKALETLRLVITEDEQILEEAHWLQVMALLQMNRPEEARPILQMLSQNINGAFQQESTRLMDRLY
ncbi:MAG TPA: tetratricopeptide repeat protein [Saprospiraceae bacterium]|nr:tetratricopeptide repeat protein [Saprospiraceae bacterium]HMQ84754.1 tetratricopeptide repeat protein [Saprospiraceae bacterium]